MEKDIIKIKYKNLSKLMSPHKINILKILKQKKKLNLTQLQKELKLSSIETRRHTSKLIKAGLVKRDKKVKQRGSPVFLSLRKK